MSDSSPANLESFLDADGELARDLGPDWPRAANLTSIVGWVTSQTEPGGSLTNVHCHQRFDQQPCGGELVAILMADESTIIWACPECQDDGILVGWEGTHWDRGGRLVYDAPLEGPGGEEAETALFAAPGETGQDDAYWQAQDLIYQAWETPYRRRREELAHQALEISPDCSDAYLILAEVHEPGSNERMEILQKAVATARRALGPEQFEEATGHFWGIFETRPYMRARLELAVELAIAERFEDAVDHCRELLRLNPNDNQGVRYFLVTYLMELDDTEALRKMFAEIPEDASTHFTYGHALFLYRTEGPGPRADQVLRDAIAYNSFVPAYLLGRKKLKGRRPPDSIRPGGEDEALVFAIEWKPLWRDTPGALKWLRDQLPKSNVRRLK